MQDVNVSGKKNVVTVTYQSPHPLNDNWALIDQPLTFKVTENQKAYLAELSKKFRYSSLSEFLRDMVFLGAKIAPHINRTIKDVIDDFNGK